MNNKEKIEALKNNPSFCSAPWVHIHSLPDGTLQPCCLWDYSVYKASKEKFGNINENSVQEILLNDSFNELRKKFLLGETVDGCSRCYDREKTQAEQNSSMRNFFNNFFIDSDEIEEYILNTNDDGSLNELNIKYLDIRFGNICNLKCRMCGHGLSSSWYEEELEILGEQSGRHGPKQKFIHSDCYDKIEQYLPYVKEIYFAGGEPFLYPEHLKMLDKLIEVGNTNCSIKYNSNMTTLKYKGRSFIDVWKNFPNVYIGASIDDMGDVVEYIRTNSSWEILRQNYEEILNKCPHVRINVSPTIGILNLETYSKFERFYLSNKWSSYPNWYNYVMWPQNQNIYYLPEWYKKKIILIYKDQIEWLKQHDFLDFVPRVNELITRLEIENNIDDDVINEKIKSLHGLLILYEKTANLDWQNSLPHIKSFLDEHYLRVNSNE